MKIAVMGAGGVGGYFGGLLARAGHPVTFVARGDHLAAIRERGLSVESTNDGNFTVAAQALEDTACLVFMEHYMAGFAATKDDADMIDIIAKTWRKMSDAGHAAALALTFPPELAALVDKGVRLAASS